jgi:hypothetical protein
MANAEWHYRPDSSYRDRHAAVRCRSVTLRSILNHLNLIQKLCIHRIYIFYMDFTSNARCFPVQYQKTGFHNWDGVCLLRGTDWIFKSGSEKQKSVSPILYLILILIYFLTAIGLTPSGSRTVHIYIQTVLTTTLITNLVGRISGILTQSGQIKM